MPRAIKNSQKTTPEHFLLFWEAVAGWGGGCCLHPSDARHPRSISGRPKTTKRDFSKLTKTTNQFFFLLLFLASGAILPENPPLLVFLGILTRSGTNLGPDRRVCGVFDGNFWRFRPRVTSIWYNRAPGNCTVSKLGILPGNMAPVGGPDGRMRQLGSAHHPSRILRVLKFYKS